ncbi:MAG: hypothetical protein ACYC0X_07565 [Pirellulaceae bacterium]
MCQSELALLPTGELVAELMRRTTFLGVVVHSEKEFREREWGPEKNFKVHLNSNLRAAEAGRLLEAIAEYIHEDPR